MENKGGLIKQIQAKIGLVHQMTGGKKGQKLIKESPLQWLNNGAMLKGWTTPTVAHVDGQWRIYSNGCMAFVPLEKALPELVAACPGATEKLEQLDLEPF